MKKIFAMIISAVIVCSTFAVTAYANDSEGGVPEGWVDKYAMEEVEFDEVVQEDPNAPLNIMEEIPIEEPGSETPVIAPPVSGNDSEGGVWVDDFPGEDIPIAEPVDPNEPLNEMEEVAVEEPEPEIPVIAPEISGNDTEGGAPEVENPQTGNFSAAIIAALAAMSAAAIVVKRK